MQACAARVRAHALRTPLPSAVRPQRILNNCAPPHLTPPAVGLRRAAPGWPAAVPATPEPPAPSSCALQAQPHCWGHASPPTAQPLLLLLPGALRPAVGCRPPLPPPLLLVQLGQTAWVGAVWHGHAGGWLLEFRQLLLLLLPGRAHQHLYRCWVLPVWNPPAAWPMRCLLSWCHLRRAGSG